MIEGSDFLVSVDTAGTVTNIFHYVVERLSVWSIETVETQKNMLLHSEAQFL